MTKVEVIQAEAVARQQLQAVRSYCEEHVDDFGDAWVEWQGREVVALAAFADHVERHRTAIDPSIRVVAVPRAHVELAPLQDPAWEFAAAFSEARVIAVRVDICRGCVSLGLEPDGDATALDAALRERFGPTVQTAVTEAGDYLGERAGRRRIPRSASRIAEGWSTDATGRELTIHYAGGRGDVRHPTIRLDETPSRVGFLIFAPTKSLRAGHRYPKSAQIRTVAVQLSEPLARRAVVNLANGRTLPRHRTLR